MARRMLAGESLQQLAGELNARGLVTTRGNPWTGANLSRLLGQHRMGGQVVVASRNRSGSVAGTVSGSMLGEPILDRATYEAVQALLASRRRGRRPTGRFLLTGLARCNRCGHAMNGATSNRDGRRMYRCPPQLGGCGQAVDAKHLEAMVDDHMVKLLADPKHARRIAAKDAKLGVARDKHHAAIDHLEQQLVDLEVKKAMGDVIPRAYDAAKRVLDTRLVTARAALAEVGAVAGAPIDASAEWEGLTGDEKRTVITRFGVNISIDPPHRPVRRWAPERVSID
jgi:hypothetical protein